MYWKIHQQLHVQLEKIMRSQEQCNTASTEAEKIREKVVFKISAEALAPCGTRSSTAVSV